MWSYGFWKYRIFTTQKAFCDTKVQEALNDRFYEKSYLLQDNGIVMLTLRSRNQLFAKDDPCGKMLAAIEDCNEPYDCEIGFAPEEPNAYTRYFRPDQHFPECSSYECSSYEDDRIMNVYAVTWTYEAQDAYREALEALEAGNIEQAKITLKDASAPYIKPIEEYVRES